MDTDARETELREAERRHIAALEALARQTRTPAAVLNWGYAEMARQLRDAPPGDPDEELPF